MGSQTHTYTLISTYILIDHLEVCESVGSASDDDVGPGGEPPAQQRLDQLQGAGLLPGAVPGHHYQSSLTLSQSLSVIISHYQSSLTLSQALLGGEAGQLRHARDLVQAVYQEEQPAPGGHLD